MPRVAEQLILEAEDHQSTALRTLKGKRSQPIRLLRALFQKRYADEALLESCARIGLVRIHREMLGAQFDQLSVP